MDLKITEKEKLTQNKKSKTNTNLATLGIGASTFLIFNISNFIKENPDAIVKIAKNSFKMIDHTIFTINYWDSIMLAWDFIDVIGFDNLAETGVDVLSLAISHADLLWDVADLVGIGADLTDAASTLGLSVLLSGATSLAFYQINKENEAKLKELKNKNLEIEKTKKYLEYAQPPEKIIQQLKLIPHKTWEF